MIDIVLGLLRDISLIREEDELSFKIFFTRDVNCFVYCSSRAFYQVKISDRRSLKPEYENLMEAFKVMPQHVPRPVGYYHRGQFELLVSEGVEHRKLSSLNNIRGC